MHTFLDVTNKTFHIAYVNIMVGILLSRLISQNELSGDYQIQISDSDSICFIHKVAIWHVSSTNSWKKNTHKPTPVPPETVFEANWYLCVFQSLFFLYFLSTWGSLYLISFHPFFSECYMSWSSGTWKTYYLRWHRNYEYEYIAWWYGGDCHVHLMWSSYQNISTGIKSSSSKLEKRFKMTWASTVLHVPHPSFIRIWLVSSVLVNLIT